MKKYTGAIIGGLFGGAVIVTLFFAIVLSGEKQGSDADKMVIVDEPAGTKQIEPEPDLRTETTRCVQGLEICNDLDDDCDGEADEGCGGPAEFEHCWTLPEIFPRIIFWGEIGYRYTSLPGDPAESRLVATTPPLTLAKAENTNSACLSLVLDPGWYLEYYTLVEPDSIILGCADSALNETHKVTLGDVPTDPLLIDGGTVRCKFRFHQPMP